MSQTPSPRPDGIAGFNHNGTSYLYRKSMQGDITHIYTKDGTLIVKYVYDAFGNHQVYAETGYEDIANLNPFRYRSYYYDGQISDTGLYYLNSRYYDPQTGRYVNADAIAELDPETINGLNLYSYCCSDPVNNFDPNGNKWWKILLGVLVAPIGISMLVGGAISAATGGSFAEGALGIGFTVGATIAIVGAMVATTVLTGGAAAGLATAMGGGFWATVGAGAIVGGISGAIVSAGFSLVQQGITNGNYDNVNWSAVGKSALIGAATGAAAGGILGGITHSMNAGVDAAKATFKTAEQTLKNTPMAFKGGTMVTERVAAQLSYNSASAMFGFAKSSATAAKLISKVLITGSKIGLNYLFNNI